MDRWFEIHRASIRSSTYWQAFLPLHVKGILIYVEDPVVLGFGTPFPMLGVLGNVQRDYFVDSFAYQIAFALSLGMATIRLFGVELLNGSARERTVEAACVSYWLGVAEGRGVRVILQDTPFSLLSSPYRYGTEEERLAVAYYTAAFKQYEIDAHQTAVANSLRLTDVMG